MTVDFYLGAIVGLVGAVLGIFLAAWVRTR